MIKLQKVRLIFLIPLIVIVMTLFSMSASAYVCTDGDSPPGCFCLNACSINSYAPADLGDLTCCSGVGTGGGVCSFYCADITDGSHYCFGGGD